MPVDPKVNTEKRSEYNKKYRAERADYFKAYEEARRTKRAAERKENYKDPAKREALLKRGREWKAENRERCLKYKQQWDDSHKQHISEAGKKYRADNPQKVAESFRQWRLKNLEYMRAHANRRRAIQLGSEGRFTAAEIRDLWRRQGGKCAYFAVCGNALQPKGFRGTHRDHIDPLIPEDPARLPGTNTIDNIQLLCRSCNQKKKNKDPYRFTQEHEGRLFPDLPVRTRRRVNA